MYIVCLYVYVSIFLVIKYHGNLFTMYNLYKKIRIGVSRVQSDNKSCVLKLSYHLIFEKESEASACASTDAYNLIQFSFLLICLVIFLLFFWLIKFNKFGEKTTMLENLATIFKLLHSGSRTYAK
jgi:hypothetical protein